MKFLKQLTLIFFICLIGEWLAKFLPFAFPGSIMAMIILSLLLLTRVIKEKDIQEVSDYLLEMLGLFIVPSSVIVIEHLELIQQIAIPLLIISLILLVLTFASCALTIRFVTKLMHSKNRRLN